MPVHQVEIPRPIFTSASDRLRTKNLGSSDSARGMPLPSSPTATQLPRRRKNHTHSLSHEDSVVVAEDRKAQIAFDFFNDILGRPPVRSAAINLEHLELPTLELAIVGHSNH
jgi:hypothetical protein